MAQSPDHILVLANSYLGIPARDINDWIDGNNLSAANIRARVTDFTTIHYCYCKCPAQKQ